jgi:hypothetical protein
MIITSSSMYLFDADTIELKHHNIDIYFLLYRMIYDFHLELIDKTSRSSAIILVRKILQPNMNQKRKYYTEASLLRQLGTIWHNGVEHTDVAQTSLEKC